MFIEIAQALGCIVLVMYSISLEHVNILVLGFGVGVYSCTLPVNGTLIRL